MKRSMYDLMKNLCKYGDDCHEFCQFRKSQRNVRVLARGDPRQKMTRKVDHGI
ncbi:MAG: hypothetical protein CM15mV18_0010 [uncultured marine virus]|nr:MAG: hypothetical protein CM15mV18_0010 [uncultured marine virus]